MAGITINMLPAATVINNTDILIIGDPSTGEMKKATKNQVVGNVITNLTDAATISWNYANGNVAAVTLGGNRTLSLSNVPSGACGLIKVKQDATGGRTLTLTGNKKSGFALSTGANQEDVLGFYFDGSSYYWSIENYGTVSGGADTTPPSIVSMTATSATNIRVVTTEAIASPTTAGWSFNNGSAITPSAVIANGSNTYDFTVAGLAAGQTITASYNSATGNWLDAAGNEVVTFSAVSVTNSIGSSSGYMTWDNVSATQNELYNSNMSIKRTTTPNTSLQGTTYSAGEFLTGKEIIMKLPSDLTAYTGTAIMKSGRSGEWDATCPVAVRTNGSVGTVYIGTSSQASFSPVANMWLKLKFYSDRTVKFQSSINTGSSWTDVYTYAALAAGTLYYGYSPAAFKDSAGNGWAFTEIIIQDLT